MNKLGAIILAAGKGTRMNARNLNKVTFPLGDKPMIMHIVHLLEELKITPIVIVIGFAKESVRSLFDGNVLFAEQAKRLGTAHAVYRALKVLPEGVDDVLVIQGDDSAFYKAQTINKLTSEHMNNNNAFTFLSIDVDDPTGLGRVLRDEKGILEAIVEEKDATPTQREIKEINPACYVISVKFLRKYLKHIKKSHITGEYYLTSLIDIAITNNEKIEIVKGGRLPWRGVNTGEELLKAQELIAKVRKKSSSPS